ncbi:fumarylacetoacetase [Roseomonas elaeocarpi]|uniref:fumarylacetoacetase n=1 Tax=Roseomonas elaeocarpi TaxID=907779 RepID=A0ABV6JST9_9PROT
MTAKPDSTHDAARRSWVASANTGATDFPIQNLPYGLFSESTGGERSIGVAIGDQVLNLRGVAEAGLLPEGCAAAARATLLDPLLALPGTELAALRERLVALLDAGAEERERLSPLLRAQNGVTMHRPTSVGNYSDFYAGIHHARAAGALLTPENPLPANYKWVPIGYHGRASSVQVSGAPVRRPLGQLPPAEVGGAPGYGPSGRLDLELEMGVVLGRGNARGEPVPVGQAAEHIAGFCLLNDWSSRDVQRWEMFPLGPFLSKSFATTVSPWVVTPEALAPFRVAAMARPEGDPAPLPYLLDAADQAAGGLDVRLSVLIRTARMRAAGEEPVVIITSNARHLYWTPAQMVTHHASNGCDLQPGDLLGTGTISGPTEAELSSLLELTVGGTRPATLPNGEVRRFLEDGDEIILRGRCERPGFAAIGFGECRGTILPAPGTAGEGARA